RLAGPGMASGGTCRPSRQHLVLWRRSGGILRLAALRLNLEPISKSPEEDNEASELYEAEEVLGVVFPTDEDATLPLNPSTATLHLNPTKEAFHEPASHIAA